MLFTMHESKFYKVLGIAPATVIDCQLPFEYTIASRSTDVMVIFISADGIKSFLLIMFLLVMFSFLLTEIESADLIYRRDYYPNKRSIEEKLDDFVQVKGGIVKFGGGDGRISGKGTIRTSKLDFENVYYVEELQHFNLFSVSQICDKKNKVLFTDTDCLVLTEDFQLPDESQVVLRIPRKCDLYTFSISELQQYAL
ncbi:hypothetical protein Tco_1034041 [Tanacetum coccineum]